MVISYSVGNRQMTFPYYKKMEELAAKFFEEDVPKMTDGGTIADINQLACFVYFIGEYSDNYLETLMSILLEEKQN